ncbi:hypothetical protein Efla_007582 [Eimeria flavescens]
MTPVGPSSAASARFYGTSVKGLKYPTYDSSAVRRNLKINECLCDTQKLLYGLRQIGNARSYSTQLRHVRTRCHAIPDSLLFNVVFVNVKQHCRVALTRLQQLRSTDNLPLDKIEEACMLKDEAEFARVSSSRASVFQQKRRNRRDSSSQAATGLALPALHVDKLSGTPVPSISAQVIRTNSLISSPKQLVFAGHNVEKNPITFFLEGSADHSIMSRAFALTNGITMQPLDPPIATTFANNSSGVIRLATQPLPLPCEGHRSFVQPLVSSGVSFDLLVGLDWLQKHNPRVYWDRGSLMLSDSDHCYNWEAVFSDSQSVAIRWCTAREIRPYPASNEAYCNYVSTIQKPPKEAQPLATATTRSSSLNLAYFFQKRG